MGASRSPVGAILVGLSALGLSLAALEYFVHLDTDLVPNELVSVSAEIPADVERESVGETDLPRNRRSYPPLEELQDIGTEWVRRGETAVLSVPSAIVPEERNFLLNPLHQAFTALRFGSPSEFHFDPRMWKPR